MIIDTVFETITINREIRKKKGIFSGDKVVYILPALFPIRLIF